MSIQQWVAIVGAIGAGPLAIRVATWVFAGFLSLNTVGNIASRSTAERYGMAPVALLLVGCFVVVGAAE